MSPPLWLAGHAGWFQEYWIARHVQRQRGEAADARGPRLASIDASADECFDPARHGRAARWRLAFGEAQALRHYLADTLETTLDLLASAEASDAGLYFYRLALRREDQLLEALAETAQALQLPDADLPWPPRPARADRDALIFGATRWLLGSPHGGFVPANERWSHEVPVPEFEIDAQAVNWARYAEFVLDGGYDDRRCWTDAGWAWLQAEARRAPRHVEQLGHSLLMQRQGRTQRVSAAQAVTHVSRHEAEAWCRWAGRRLPTEVEWEIAAVNGASRGFAWGDVFEWCAGSARAWPGRGATPPGFADLPAPGTLGVLRGGSWLTRPRWLHPRARRFAAPQHDAMFCGFRSCAI